MEKGKKQKKKAGAAAAAAHVRPEKKIKKAQTKKKGKLPDTNPTPSGTAHIYPSKAPGRAPAPSGVTQIVPSKPSVPAPGPVQIPSANHNDVKALAEREKKGDSGQRVAGFIFMCNGKTKALCYQYRVFGLPRGKLAAVEKIKKGAKLFLYDYDLKLLYGVYKATCNGGLDLLATAFKGAFPAQVKFEVFRDCLPIPEATLKQAIKENYENTNRFKPELNSQQVQSLLAVFQPVSQKQQSANPRVAEGRHAPRPVEERSRTGGPAYASNQVDHRYIPPLVPNVQNDPYASAAHINRAPFFMDPGLVPGTRLPPSAGAYHPAAFGWPPPNDVYHPEAVGIHPAVGLPPPNDVYHTAAVGLRPASHVYHPAAFGLPPSNDTYLPAAGSIYQKDSRLHTQSSTLLERYRAVPQMIPSEQAPAAVRDYRSVTLRESEVASRMDHANQFYHTDQAVARTAELLPQWNNWPTGYENSSRIHADRLHGPVSSRANMPNLPVSSLYSFAGAAPAYR